MSFSPDATAPLQSRPRTLSLWLSMGRASGSSPAAQGRQQHIQPHSRFVQFSPRGLDTSQHLGVLGSKEGRGDSPVPAGVGECIEQSAGSL